MRKGVRQKSKSEVAQSRPTLRDPMDCSLPGSSIHGILLYTTIPLYDSHYLRVSSF